MVVCSVLTSGGSKEVNFSQWLGRGERDTGIESTRLPQVRYDR